MERPTALSNRHKRRQRRAWVITSVIALALLVVSAIVFAISAGTRRITTAAQSLHLADESLLVTTAAQAQLGFAVHFAIVEADLRADTGDTDPLADAIQSLDDLEGGFADVRAFTGELDPALASAHTTYLATGRELVAALAAGDLEEARRISLSRLDADYLALSELIIEERERQFAAVFSADALMARMGDIARFLVALMIPLAVIVIYRELVRRQQRQAELEVRLQAERTLSKARDDFVANASHELRTPLTSIYGLSQLIEEDDVNPETTREMAEMISTEASDLARMVEDLLTAARLDAGALTFQQEQVMTHDEALEMVRPFQRTGSEIGLEVKPAVVRADRLRQRQVIRNLVSNARKYGGDTIKISGRRDGSMYMWTVSDDGPGIPEELQARLFERFIHQGTTVVVPGGVGLGLSIVKALAEGMGGSVSHTREDGWTNFHVTVPLAAPSAVDRSERSRLVGAPSGGGFEVSASTPYTEPDRRK